MSESFDKCESAMLGHALANNFQASTYMAIEIGKSLCSIKEFNASDIMSHYLYLYYDLEYPMGDVIKLVYEQLKSDIKSNKKKLTREQFRFPLDRIHNASKSAHDQLKGLSAGCNPAQRSYPLALCPWIDDTKLFEISCEEARLTHFSTQAGQVSGIINLICRRLIKGDEWNDAILFAFKNAPSNLSGDIKEIQTRYQHNAVLNTHGNSAFAPNVLNATLYCVTKSNSYADALKIASETERDYCPTLVGLLAALRWGVPQSIIANSQNEHIERLKKISTCFIKEWKRQWAIANGTNKSFLKNFLVNKYKYYVFFVSENRFLFFFIF